MATNIPLKRKYLTAEKGRYRAGYSGNNNKAKLHRALTDREKALHAAQPAKVMILLPNGKVRMFLASASPPAR